MRSFLLVLAAALSACTIQADRSDAGAGAEPPAAASPAPAIEGRWEVVKIDGAPPVINIAGYAPVVTIGDGRIHFQSQCIYADWKYARDGEALTTARHYEPGSGMCARGLAPGETAIEAAFDAAERVALVASGVLRVEGGGPRLELRRTELASDGRTAGPAPAPTPSATPDPRAPATLAGEYRVAGIDGTEVAGQVGIALTITDQRLHFEPRCLGFDWTYTYAGGALATKRAPLPPGPRCLAAVGREQARLAAALDAAARATRTPANGIELAGGGRSVLLFSQ